MDAKEIAEKIIATVVYSRDIKRPYNDCVEAVETIVGEAFADEKMKTQIQHNFYLVAIDQRDQAEARLKEAVAKEREECAKRLEELHRNVDSGGDFAKGQHSALDFGAVQIRARSKGDA